MVVVINENQLKRIVDNITKSNLIGLKFYIYLYEMYKKNY